MIDADTPTNIAEYSVSEVSNAVKASIEDQFGYVRVRGELGRVSRPASGHVYLDLKDDKSVLSGVIWRGAASKLTIKPEQGLEVIATGRLTTFAGQSKYQMIIDRMEPAGAGALMALLEERKKKLAAEGLFATERKKALPYLPRVIGVVTSPTGAVIRDILHRVKDRFAVHVIVWPVRVQGENCAREVAAGIDGFNALPENGPIRRPDVLIVARGGGSLEDLWGFNEEEPARAVARSTIPVISAVGHETDTTLIDYVADLRAPTPTGAAEMALPVKSELMTSLGDLSLRCNNALERGMERRRADLRSAARALPQPQVFLAQMRQRFDIAAERLGRSLENGVALRRGHFDGLCVRLRPGLVVGEMKRQKERLDERSIRLVYGLEHSAAGKRDRYSSLSGRLHTGLITIRAERHGERLNEQKDRMDRAAAQITLNKRQSLASSGRLLESLSHKGVLARGFALVKDKEGHPLRRAGHVSAGQALRLEFADGEIRAVANLLDPFEPSPEGGVTDSSPTSGQGTDSSPKSGIMASDSISAEDIEANLRHMTGKRARRRSVPVTKVPTRRVSSIGKKKPSSSTALLDGEALSNEALDREVLERAKALLKPRGRKPSKPDDDAQGSLF